MTNKNRKPERILITGGSKGLGLSLGLQYAKSGAQVTLVARSHPDLLGLNREGIHFMSADIGDARMIHPIAGYAAQMMGGSVDLLINCASTLGSGSLRPLLDSDCEDFERALQVNLLGPFRLTKAVLGQMLLRGQGTILNISSDAAVEAFPDWGIYSATKAALDHLTRVWAEETRRNSIRFLSVDPGEMDTDLHRQALPGSDVTLLRSPEDSASRVIALLATDNLSGSRIKV